ncbi:glutamate 5-kinase [Metabacillus indicus]|uniref:Glutamate 5-kinase n=1 Tax=Metabacillus indicus TaxID=246786 RepID=A0A084H220_METID|nr:glutamate 5-kinase [Metabacillus indicus]KEZ53632.1 hypothetical protein GS18_0201220 [Metabacillus indicus]
MKKRIVVKIGSSSLTNRKGEIDQEKFTDHIAALARLRQAGHEVLLVSSGAVAAGFRKLGYPARPLTLKGRQAAAAVGQSLLIQAYMAQLGAYGFVPAQILLTRTDFSSKERYRNAFATIRELLDRGLIPIINENDTVSVEELTFGDNDMLSALVSGLVQADELVILTDINGLYDKNPRDHTDAKRYDRLTGITDEMMLGAEGAGSSVGTGGMKSKLAAAKTAIELGVSVFIGTGRGDDKFIRILSGEGDGTYIEARSFLKSSKQWIALHSLVKGKIFIDEGAESALIMKGKSLLPAGVCDISGTFESGDVVEVHGPNGVLGKGEVYCSSETLKQVMGKRTKEAGAVLASIEVIHRDRWVKA